MKKLPLIFLVFIILFAFSVAPINNCDIEGQVWNADGTSVGLGVDVNITLYNGPLGPVTRTTTTQAGGPPCGFCDNLYSISFIGDIECFGTEQINSTSWNSTHYGWNDTTTVVPDNVRDIVDIYINTEWPAPPDTTPPIITLIDPPDNGVQNSSTVILIYNVTDPSGIFNCTLLINNTFNQTDTSIENGTLNNFTLNSLVPGNYNWSINCTDNADARSSNVTETRIFTANPSSLLTVALVEPVSNLQLSQNQTFNFTANVTCSINDCGNITAYLLNDTSLMSNITGTFPLFTFSDNPQNTSCTEHMKPGDSCNVTWLVNASGLPGTYYVSAYFNSTNGSIQGKQTSNISVTISSEQLGCGASITSNLIFPQSLINSTGGNVCPDSGLIINAPHITIDCAGYPIYGDNSGTSDYGIHINLSQNVTIINCNIIDFYYSIYADGSQLANITNNNLSSATWEGILAFNSPHSIITDNIISNTGYGIIVTSGNNVTVAYNYVNQTSQAHIQTNSDLNNISYNTINNTGSGITITSSADSNIISSNTVHSTTTGIMISGTNNSAYDNVFTSISQIAIRLLSSNNILHNNSVSYSGNGIELFGNASNNTLTNNTIASTTHALIINGTANLIENTSFSSNNYDLIVYSLNNIMQNSSDINNAVFWSTQASVNFTSPINLTESINFSEYITLSNNFTFVNTTSFNSINLNATANITLYNIVLSNPKAQIDKEDDGTFIFCESPQCEEHGYASNTFVFSVLSFTRYRATEDPGSAPVTLNLTFSNSTINHSFTIFANATDSNSNINNCTIIFQYGDSVWSKPGNLSGSGPLYNCTSSLHNLSDFVPILENISVIVNFTDSNGFSNITQNLTNQIPNHDPITTSIQVLPSPANETTNLSCNFTYIETDGDNLTFAFRWYLNNSAQDLFTQNISYTYLTENDNWSCSVSVNDSYGGSSYNRSDNITIQGVNFPPIAYNISFINSTINHSFQLLANATDTDNNIDNCTIYYGTSLQYSKPGNLTLIGSTYYCNSTLHNLTDLLPVLTTLDIQVNFTDNQGASSLTPIYTNQLPNHAPMIPQVNVIPWNGTELNNFTCNYTSSDTDLDNITHNFEWFKNGIALNIYTQNLTNQDFNRYDNLSCSVNASDSFGATYYNRSDNVTVQKYNTPPGALNLTFSNSSINHSFHIFANATDNESNIINCTLWYTIGSTLFSKNSSPIQLNQIYRCNFTLSNETDELPILQYINFSIEFHDYYNESSNTSIYTNQIPNYNPIITLIEARPCPPNESTNLTCNFTYINTENDNLTFAFRWYLNGSAQDLFTQNISYTYLTRYDNWSCSVAINDSYGGWSFNRSENITIQGVNKEPIAYNISFINSTVNHSFILLANATDTDVNMENCTVFFGTTGLTQSKQGILTNIDCYYLCNASIENVTDLMPVLTNIQVQVNFTDSNGLSNLSPIYINQLPNHAPMIPQVNVIPWNGTELNNFTCNYTSSDTDLDNITHNFEWFKNGIALNIYTQNLTNQDFNRYDNLSCSVNASDSFGATYYNRSDNVTVQKYNSPPAALNLTFSNSSINHSFHIFANATDNESNMINCTLWYSIGSGLSSKNSSPIQLGQIYSCNFTLHNETDFLPVLQDINFSIEFHDYYNESSNTSTYTNQIPNHNPTVTSIDVLPTLANESTNLTCNITYYDTDSDNLTISYAWFLNGSAQDLFTQNISYTYLTRSDNWSCSASVNDSYGGTSYNRSINVTIQGVNQPPAAYNISFINSTINHSFQLLANATDPDDNIVNCTVIYGTSLQYSKPGNLTQIGSIYYCNSTLHNITESLPVLTNIQVQVNFTDLLGSIGTTSIYTNQLPNQLSAALNVQVLPSSPVSYDDLTCNYTFFDIDGDSEGSTNFTWYLNGTLTPYNSSILYSGNTSEENNWSCEVTPVDEFNLIGLTNRSDNVTIGGEVGWTDISFPDGVYEPHMASYSGTHLFTFNITFNNFSSGSGYTLECQINRSDGSIITLNKTLTSILNGNESLNYTITPSDSVDANVPWQVLNCSIKNVASTVVFTDNSTYEASGYTRTLNRRIYVHSNSWTAFDETTDDAFKAWRCWNGNPYTYFNNTVACDYDGDVVFAKDMSINFTIEGRCHDAVDNDLDGNLDCSDIKCQGITYNCFNYTQRHSTVAEFIPYFNPFNPGVPPFMPLLWLLSSLLFAAAFISLKNRIPVPSGAFIIPILLFTATIINSYVVFAALDTNPEACPGNICTGSVTVGGVTTNYYYTNHVQPSGLFKIRIDSGTSAGTHAFGRAIKNMPFFLQYGRYNYTHPYYDYTTDSTLFDNTTYEITAPSGNSGDDDWVMWVNLSGAAATSHLFNLSIVQYGATSDATNLEFFVDANAPSNDNESYTAVGMNLTWPCADSVDNDLDGAYDCLDYQCNNSPGNLNDLSDVCEYGTESTCNDRFDNDFDLDGNSGFDYDAETGADCRDLDCDNRQGGATSNLTCHYLDESANYPLSCQDSFNNDADSGTGTFANLAAAYSTSTYQDCYDTDCWGLGNTSDNITSNPCPRYENNSVNWCADGIDNDFDNGAGSRDTSTTTGIDCMDYDCYNANNGTAQLCTNNEAYLANGTLNASQCFDGLDNDLDSPTDDYFGASSTLNIDCNDADCIGITDPVTNHTCLTQEFNLSLGIQYCNNNVTGTGTRLDDDGDDPDADYIFEIGEAGVNCEDSDCHQQFGSCGPCPSQENLTFDSCADSIDNDLDLTDLIDCADSDCLGELGNTTGSQVCAASENSNTLCSDGFDNDRSGSADCADTSCYGYLGPQSQVCGLENNASACSDNLDNDADGLIDCAESSCAGLASCASTWTTASCIDIPSNSTSTLVSSPLIQVIQEYRIKVNATHTIRINNIDGYTYSSYNTYIGSNDPSLEYPFNLSECYLTNTTVFELLLDGGTNSHFGRIRNKNSLPFNDTDVILVCNSTSSVMSSNDYQIDFLSLVNGTSKSGTVSVTVQAYEDVSPTIAEIEVSPENLNNITDVRYGGTVYYRAVPSPDASGICACSVNVNGTAYTTGSNCLYTHLNQQTDITINVSARAEDGADNTGAYSINKTVTINVQPTLSTPLSFNLSKPFLVTGQQLNISAAFQTASNGNFPGTTCNVTIVNATSGEVVNTTSISKSGTSIATCSGLISLPSADGMYHIYINISDEDSDSVISNKRSFYVCNSLASTGQGWSCNKADFDQDGAVEGLYTILYGSQLACDNCLSLYNPAQLDSNANGIGDECESITAPTITIISPLSDDNITGFFVLLNFTTNQAYNWSRYTLDSDPQYYTLTQTSSTSAYKQVFIPTPGVHNITVYANNSYGRMSNVTVSFSTFNEPAKLQGTVRDSNNTIYGAIIDLIQINGSSMRVNTDIDGFYYLNVSAGIYGLKVTKPGFITYTTNITLAPGTITTNNVILVPSAVSGSVIGELYYYNDSEDLNPVDIQIFVYNHDTQELVQVVKITQSATDPSAYLFGPWVVNGLPPTTFGGTTYDFRTNLSCINAATCFHDWYPADIAIEEGHSYNLDPSHTYTGDMAEISVWRTY